MPRSQVIVQARKPDFFSYNMSLYEVVTPDGLMRPVMRAAKGGLFCGGSARMVEAALGMEGDDILYVGDHIYTDAALAKIHFRWRTALIVRRLPLHLASSLQPWERGLVSSCSILHAGSLLRASHLGLCSCGHE